MIYDFGNVLVISNSSLEDLCEYVVRIESCRTEDKWTPLNKQVYYREHRHGAGLHTLGSTALAFFCTWFSEQRTMDTDLQPQKVIRHGP